MYYKMFRATSNDFQLKPQYVRSAARRKSDMTQTEIMLMDEVMC